MTLSFRDRFKASQNFEDMVLETIAAGGKIGPSGPFPKMTREQAEAMILGWSNQLEAMGTVLIEKVVDKP